MEASEEDPMDESLHSDEESSSDDHEKDAEDEEETLRQIEDLEEKLAQAPYEYKLHVDLIQLLRKVGELDKLREARGNMAKIFPLTQMLWLEWIEDEKKFAESEEDHSRIVDLFEAAVKDYMCPEVWLEYSQYCIRWMDSPDGLRRIREVMERSIAAVGLHATEGAALWEMFREFENALLLNIQPQPGSIPSAEQQEKIKKQTDKILSLFKGQLAVPLMDMENTFREFLEWSESEVDPGIRHMYEQALKQLEELKPLENSLSQAAPSAKLELYQNYIQHEIKSGSYARVQCIYERALVENCLNSELWMQYLKYMSHQPNSPQLLIETHLRSVRNCPWTGQLWVLYLLALERTNATKEKLDEVFNEALSAGYTSAHEYVELWRTRCTQIRRRISAGEDGPEPKAELTECFDSAIKYITDKVLSAFGESGDPNYTMWTFWARCEACILGHKKKATEILQSLLQEDADARRKVCLWREYYNIERLFGGEDRLEKCRSILRQAVQNCAILPDSAGGVPDAEIACEMLLDFEREHGNLKDMDESTRRTNNKLSRISKRREREAAAYAEQQKSKEKQQKQRSKKQSPRKRKATNETRNSEGDELSKREKRTKFTEPMQADQGFKAPAGLPVRYVKKAKVTSQAEEETQKSGPPLGFKAPPPPGFKGPPPGFKPSPTSDVNNNKDKKSKGVAADKKADIQTGSSGNEPTVDKKTIFVSNLDFKLVNVEEKLRRVFRDCGEITEIRLVKNNKGQFRGFGYIEFLDESAVQEALKMDRKDVEGRPMFVSPNVDKKKEPNFKVFKYDLGLEKHKLFVSNLSFHTTEETLKEEFSKHGALKEIRIVTNRKGQSKGLAYVEYENEVDAAQAVMKMDGKEIDGFEIKVAISNPPARKLAPEVFPSLGGSREQFKGGRGRGRTQLSMLPRSIQRTEKSQNGNKEPESRPSTSGGMTNKDFAKLLVNK